MKILPNFCFCFLIISGCADAQNNARPYDEIKNAISLKRNAFQTAYETADSAGKIAIINEARLYVFNMIKGEIFEAWYGTPWDFDGTTTIPGKGKIACGYFVTTVIRDAGFQIPRVQWAQQASENIILNMTKDVKRFRNRPVEDVMNYIDQKGDGLYIVGLDLHVGFIYKSGNTIQFVHSNYYNPDVGVMSQDLNSYNPLSNSSYRVIGKILGDEMMVNWIMEKKY